MNQITQNYCTLIPVYGRDYKSKAAAIADFRAGKDFRLQMPTQDCYCSIRDFAPGTTVNIRYKKLTMVAAFKVPASALAGSAVVDYS